MCPLMLLLVICVSGMDPLGEVSGSHDRGQGYSYVYIGDTLQLNCTLNESSSWEAEDLLFFLDTESCENELCGKITSDLQVINNRTLQMNRLINSSKDGREYECFIMTPQGKLTPVDSHKVYVQYRPQEVENICCEVYDWDSRLTCNWDFGVEYISNDIEDHSSPAIAVNASVYTQSKPDTLSEDPCPRIQTQSQDKDPMRMCVWAGQHFFASSQYVLEVIVINTITKDKKATHHRILTSKIVKPSPVKRIWAEDRNSTCIRLAWNHIRIHRDKVFRLNTSFATWKNYRILDKTGEWICGLSAYTTYTFSLECQATQSGTQEGFWSDAKTINLTTAESEPASSFEVHRGGYVLHSCDMSDRRNVTIYLKAVPRNERNGEIIGYSLKYNGTVMDVNQTTPTSAEVQNIPCAANVSVSIYSRTKVGPSRTNARLVIVQDKQEAVSDFAVKMTAGELHAVWNTHTSPNTVSTPVSGASDVGEAEGPGNVTVFWCLRDKLQSDRRCKGEVEWRMAAFSSGQLQIPYPQQHDPQDSLYGISHGGHALTWTSCLFNPQEKIRAPKWVAAYPDTDGLNIKWLPQQCSAENYPVHVTMYRIRICEKSRCNDTFRVVDVEGGGSYQKKVSSAKDVEYKVEVQAGDSEGHFGPTSQPVFAVLSTEQGSVPVWFILTVVLVATLVMTVMVSSIICHKRCSHHKGKFRETMDYSEFGSRLTQNRKYIGLPSTPAHAISSPQTTESALELGEEEEFEEVGGGSGFTASTVNNSATVSSDYSNSVPDSTEDLLTDSRGAAVPVPSSHSDLSQDEEVRRQRYPNAVTTAVIIPSNQHIQPAAPDRLPDAVENLSAYVVCGSNTPSVADDQASDGAESLPAYVACGSNTPSGADDQASDGAESLPAYMACGRSTTVSEREESSAGGSGETRMSSAYAPRPTTPQTQLISDGSLETHLSRSPQVDPYLKVSATTSAAGALNDPDPPSTASGYELEETPLSATNTRDATMAGGSEDVTVLNSNDDSLPAYVRL